MTVHMFRVFIGRGPMSVTDLETRINDWVASNPEWEADNISHTLTEFVDDQGNLVCYKTPVRFREDDTKANLVQKLEDKIKNKADWYRIGYHTCYSDGNPHDLCGPTWDDKVEWTAKDVTIPSNVPDFQIA